MKPFILLLTTGRTGSYKFKHILDLVPGMYAEDTIEHEDPNLSYGNVLRQNLIDPSIGRAFVEDKLKYIEQLPGNYYCDTSNLIGQGFFEHFLELNAIPHVVILRRDPREVACSFYQLGWLPKIINHHFLNPSDPNVLQMPGWETMHPYQWSYWFCLEMERRIQMYLKQLKEKNALVWESSIPQMLELEHFNAMLTYFSIPTIDHIPQNVVNGRNEFKIVNQLPSPRCLDMFEAKVRSCTGTDHYPSLHELKN